MRMSKLNRILIFGRNLLQQTNIVGPAWELQEMFGLPAMALRRQST